MVNRLSSGRVQGIRRSQPASTVVRGRLVHDDVERTPLHQLRVEVFFHDGRRESFLARGITGANGRFGIHVALPARWEGKRLQLRVIELRPPQKKDEPLQRRWRVIARLETEPMENPDRTDVGQVAVPHWEYRAGPLPRLALSLDDPPQVPSEAAEASFRIRHRRALEVHLSQPWLRDPNDPLGSVMSAWPPPTLPHDDGPEAVVALLLDSALSQRLEPEGEGWRLELPAGPAPAVGRAWHDYVSARFERAGATLAITEVRLGDAPTVVDGQDPRFPAAVVALGTRIRLESVVDEGLAGLHLCGERYAIAAWRHLRASPLATLLLPHLKDVALVNALGEGAVFTDPSLLLPLLPWSREGLALRLVRAVAERPMEEWSAPVPLCAGHRWAHVGARVATMLAHHVKRFVVNHEADLERHWVEVERFTADVDAHRPWADPAAPRPHADIGSTMDEPGIAAVERLCTSILFQTVFAFGWWRHHIVERLADPRAGTLLRRGSGDVPIPLTTGSQASLQAMIGRLLAPTGEHALVDDPEGDVLPVLRRDLTALEEELQPYGVDVRQFQARIIY